MRELRFLFNPHSKRDTLLAQLRERAGAFVSDDQAAGPELLPLVQTLARNFGNDNETCEALCAAVGSAGNVVPGRHSWLLADPDAFGEVMANSVVVARAAREMQSRSMRIQRERKNYLDGKRSTRIRRRSSVRRGTGSRITRVATGENSSSPIGFAICLPVRTSHR